MKKFLKNYTSDVPVSQTIYKIEQVLIRCGVSGITKEYGPNPGQVVAMRFHIPTAEGNMTIRLPADVNKAQEAMWLDYADGDALTSDGKRLAWNSRKKLTMDHFREQAERTAWKIIQDWVEVQMSMIQMRQAETLEVFMPYLWDGSSTMYHQLKGSGFKGVLPEKT